MVENELLEQAQEPDWPRPNEWYQATVIKNFMNAFLICKLTNHEDVHVCRRAVSLSPGGCICKGLSPGTVCSVRIRQSPKGYKMSYTAIELVCQDEPEKLEEQGVIDNWNDRGSFGSVLKPCTNRCQIFALTKSRSVTYDFKPGDPVSYRLERSTGKTWLAKDVEPIDGMPETGEGDDND